MKEHPSWCGCFVCKPLPQKTKAKRGRPSLTGETGQRYQVTIPPSIQSKIRKHGKGSLSRGIIQLAQYIKSHA